MIALLIFCVAAASAAPHYNDRHFPFHHEPHFQDMGLPYFRENIFDTGRFWAELSSELRQLDEMMANFHSRFPTSVSTAGVDGKEYKVTIPLGGFEEKDIVVKARVGVLMIQAIHKYEGDLQKTYIDVRTLPEFVDVNGTWTYEKEVLKIVFPLKEVPTTEASVKRDENPTTVAPTQSREEMDNNVEGDNQDADVGVGRGDTEKERQLSTNDNWKQGVEATTYAVDLKDEVEFVPVHY